MVKKINSKSPKGRNRRSQANGNGAARTPLLPSGVNNQATMPVANHSYSFEGEEVIDVLTVPTGSTPGSLIYSGLITPILVRRLGILSTAWQRIDWHKASVHLVTLNGSVVQSGYTMGFVEDPELTVPTDPKDIIGFLTALRSTTVRQNWVESTSGVQVSMADKPEMYTQLGSDVRRFSPGRIVVALAGDVGQTATFQLMLKYKVRLYVPAAVVSATPNVLDFTASLTRNLRVDTTSFTLDGTVRNYNVPFKLPRSVLLGPNTGVKRSELSSVVGGIDVEFRIENGFLVVLILGVDRSYFHIGIATGTNNFDKIPVTGNSTEFSTYIPT